MIGSPVPPSQRCSYREQALAPPMGSYGSVALGEIAASCSMRAPLALGHGHKAEQIGIVLQIIEGIPSRWLHLASCSTWGSAARTSQAACHGSSSRIGCRRHLGLRGQGRPARPLDRRLHVPPQHTSGPGAAAGRRRARAARVVLGLFRAALRGLCGLSLIDGASVRRLVRAPKFETGREPACSRRLGRAAHLQLRNTQAVFTDTVVRLSETAVRRGHFWIWFRWRTRREQHAQPGARARQSDRRRRAVADGHEDPAPTPRARRASAAPSPRGAACRRLRTRIHQPAPASPSRATTSRKGRAARRARGSALGPALRFVDYVVRRAAARTTRMTLRGAPPLQVRRAACTPPTCGCCRARGRVRPRDGELPVRRARAHRLVNVTRGTGDRRTRAPVDVWCGPGRHRRRGAGHPLRAGGTLSRSCASCARRQRAAAARSARSRHNQRRLVVRERARKVPRARARARAPPLGVAQKPEARFPLLPARFAVDRINARQGLGRRCAGELPFRFLCPSERVLRLPRGCEAPRVGRVALAVAVRSPAPLSLFGGLGCRSENTATARSG